MYVHFKLIIKYCVFRFEPFSITAFSDHFAVTLKEIDLVPLRHALSERRLAIIQAMKLHWTIIRVPFGLRSWNMLPKEICSPEIRNNTAFNFILYDFLHF